MSRLSGVRSSTRLYSTESLPDYTVYSQELGEWWCALALFEAGAREMRVAPTDMEGVQNRQIVGCWGFYNLYTRRRILLFSMVLCSQVPLNSPQVRVSHGSLIIRRMEKKAKFRWRHTSNGSDDVYNHCTNVLETLYSADIK